MLKLLTAFLSKVASRLGGIAWATKSGLKGKDLHGNVWLAASEIEQHRGHPVNFEDTTDQELVMSRVYWTLKRERDWRLDGAVSLDAECEENSSWAERIPETISMEPEAVLARRESATREEQRLAAKFSQAVAYLILLRNFKGDRKRVCTYLAIAKSTLSDRMIRAGKVANRQNSLFDGHHVIDDDFKPPPGRALLLQTIDVTEADQVSLLFDLDFVTA